MTEEMTQGMKDRTENLSGNDQQPDHENRTVKKAAIILSDRSFEYDIYTLVIAFFPNIPSPVFNPGEKLPEDADLVVSAILEEETTVLRVEAAAGGSAFSAALLPYSQERILPTGRNGDRAAVKNLLKGSLYEMLRDCTGRDLPWGNLTGIRPVRLAMQFLQEEMGPSQSSKDAERLAGQDMQDAYYVSPGKAALASEIAAREHRILKKIAPQDGYSLYVGIPFCPSICLYCSFSSGTLSVWQKEVDRYLDCLILEIQSCGMHSPHPCFPGKRLQTVYIGGGTPTTLSPEQMDRLLCALEENFPMDTVLEFTVEAGRPDSINAQKLRVLREHHVSRISINPQTMNQETLDLIGRKHTVEETIEAYQLARELGFDNINMDLIVGLPGEGIREVDHTMKVLEELDPDDITVHALALKQIGRAHV